MSNWNVHAAVGNFFDLGGGAGGGAAGIPRPQAPVPPPLTLNLDMNLLRDITVGEGESVQPATGTHVYLHHGLANNLSQATTRPFSQLGFTKFPSS